MVILKLSLGQSSAAAILAQPKLATTRGSLLRSKYCGGEIAGNSDPFTCGSALRRDGRALLFNPRCPMMKISFLATATAVASLLLMGSVSAQTTAPAKTDAHQDRDQGASGKEGRETAHCSLPRMLQASRRERTQGQGAQENPVPPARRKRPKRPAPTRRSSALRSSVRGEGHSTAAWLMSSSWRLHTSVGAMRLTAT